MWTIGYGTTFINGKPVTQGMTCTKEQAEAYFKADCVKFENCVNDFVKIALTQNEFDALVSLCYNIGEGNFRSSTLVKRLNAGDKVGAAEEFLKWNKGRVNGQLVVINGLVNRRKRERDLFLTKETKASVMESSEPVAPPSTSFKDFLRSMFRF